MRVLIEDDSMEFGMLCADSLQNENIDAVTIKKGGENLLEALKGSHFDIVIMDLLELNDDIISKIKSYNTRIIVISAYDMPNIEKKAIKSGVDFFLLKPFDINVLIKIIKELGSNSDKK